MNLAKESDMIEILPNSILQQSKSFEIINQTEHPFYYETSLVNEHEWIENCPCRHCGYDQFGNKEIVCDTGGINDIPFERILSTIEIIDISAPSEKPNNLTLGPLFYRFRRLKKLRITKSNVPAI
ncbi:hypothetical protein QR98_0072400, partial [Sarcoptes scabiei]